MNVKTGFAVIAFGLAASGIAMTPALAQTTPTPAPGSKQVIPEKQGGTIHTGRSESLSKKLSRTGGVIAPGGDVDPGIKAPAPDPTPHSMPVIPPSATGGDTAR